MLPCKCSTALVNSHNLPTSRILHIFLYVTTAVVFARFPEAQSTRSAPQRKRVLARLLALVSVLACPLHGFLIVQYLVFVPVPDAVQVLL